MHKVKVLVFKLINFNLKKKSQHYRIVLGRIYEKAMGISLSIISNQNKNHLALYSTVAILPKLQR